MDIDTKLDDKCYKIPFNRWEGFVIDKDGYLLVQNERIVLVSQIKQLFQELIDEVIRDGDHPIKEAQRQRAKELLENM